jgi:hypothetical protein
MCRSRPDPRLNVERSHKLRSEVATVGELRRAETLRADLRGVLYAAGLLVWGLRQDRAGFIRDGLTTLLLVAGKLFLVDLA